MKKIFIYIILIAGMLVGCENQPMEYQDYAYQTVYFPIQLPIRTLSLGEDRIDNSLDKQFIFDIGVNLGGMYKNTKNWTVDYVVDTSLTTKVYNSITNLKIIPLPPAYYTLNPVGTITIPKGSFVGLVRAQLTDAFFNDTIAITGQYVVPLKITGTSADSILMGLSSMPGADPRIKAQWESNKSPKYWTMFGIKYVNAYHGTYLHRGADVIKVTATGSIVQTVRWHSLYPEKDLLIKLATIGRRKVISNGLANVTAANQSMTLEFTNDFGTSGAVTITPRVGSIYSVTGTGQYNEKASSVEGWTGLIFQSMYLSYTYVDGANTHNVTDTLTFRDRGIAWQENSIKIVP